MKAKARSKPVWLLFGAALACAPRPPGPKSVEAPPYPPPKHPTQPAQARDQKVKEHESPVQTNSPSRDLPKAEEPAQVAEEADVHFRRALPDLDRFYRRLAELEKKRAQTSVRILWLGDSHTAADFLTDAVRRELWSKFPSGGLGFVHVGLEGTRHGGVESETIGKFRREPIAPAAQTQSLDGVFGYGGVRTLPRVGAIFRLKTRTDTGRFTLTYRLSPGDSLKVTLNGKVEHLAQGVSEAKEAPTTWLSHHDWTVADELKKFEVSVQATSGTPEIFGADLESRSPGIILDTVGVNGARLRTPLAWEPEQWRAELARRAPDLVVISFGTNEAFDKKDPAKYAEDLRELVARVRHAVPAADFWIHGPPDSRRTSGEPNPRVAEIGSVLESEARALHCAFTSQAELMSLEGGFLGWREHSPPWARPDNIHLTVDGYEELGKRVARILLGAEAPEVAPQDKPSKVALLW
jgi:lysophospholipase L1-like esterase